MCSGAFERLLCQNAIVETFPCVLGSVGVRDDCVAWGMEEALYMIVNAATARSDRKFSTRRGVVTRGAAGKMCCVVLRPVLGVHVCDLCVAGTVQKAKIILN